MKRLVIFPAAVLAVLLLLGLPAGSRKPVTVSLVGDILLDRGVGAQIAAKGLEYPCEKVRVTLRQADIVYGNLECPLTLEGTPLLKNRNLVFKADPDHAGMLKNTGFTILNLANNHTMDYGRQGLENTLDALAKEGIRATGGGSSRDKAHAPVFVKESGLTLGFLGFSAFPPEGYFYLENRPDIARVDKERIWDTIREAREQCDFLVVSFHWGKEFDFLASKEQKLLAHLAVDSGADAVVGHHPHVLQGMEMYKGKLIAYSLGNFVFDRQIPKGTDETVIVNLTVTRKGIDGVELIPVRINDCQPAVAKGQDALHILDRLKLYSEGMNGRITIQGDRGYLNVP